MESQLREFCRHLQTLLPKEECRYLLAFSGGVDSVVLAQLFLKLELPFELAHVNYQLRGEESAVNSRFCQEFAKKNDLKLHLKVVTDEEKRVLENENLQAAARNIRYRWFKDLLQENNLDFLLSAHHADDQIETVLLHQFRGAGLQGLKGMNYHSGNHLRPLLDFYKAEIENLALENKWEWSQDSSNFKDDYNRNYVRKQLVPMIESRIPAFKKTMIHNVEVWKDEASLMDFFLQQFLKANLITTQSGEYLTLEALRSIPAFRSILHAWIGNLGFNESNYRQLQQVYESYDGERKILLHGGELRLLRDRLELVFQNNVLKTPLELLLKIQDGTEQQIVDDSATYNICVRNENEAAKSKFIVYLDKAETGKHLTIRRWREGDKIRLRGLNGSKKLSDLFVSHKYDRNSKEQALVVELDAKIIAVWPLRVADGFDQNKKGQLRLEIDLLESI
ncbi:MAG: tRNA lysidine(34) synthetase TilS [Chitinophagales bacterium]|nr:tRNA lysidine(34) synthetase TilS [Chitinophagales bacterium]